MDETKSAIDKVINFISKVFKEMNGSDMLYIVIYWLGFIAIKQLMKYGVIFSPTTFSELMGGWKYYSNYSTTFLILFLLNIIAMISFCVSEDGVVDRFKEIKAKRVNYYLSDKITNTAWVGNVLLFISIIVVNGLVFTIFSVGYQMLILSIVLIGMITMIFIVPWIKNIISRHYRGKDHW